MTQKYPVIIVDLPEPVSGWWDGGKKSHFEFKSTPKTHNAGSIKWGSWSANFFFTVGAGVSWNAAIAIAKRWIINHIKIKNVKISVEWRSE